MLLFFYKNFIYQDNFINNVFYISTSLFLFLSANNTSTTSGKLSLNTIPFIPKLFAASIFFGKSSKNRHSCGFTLLSLKKAWYISGSGLQLPIWYEYVPESTLLQKSNDLT